MSKNILVIGDVMLDRYWYGNATKLSQEAPVPILRFVEEEMRCGAAANVAANCATMGAKVCLLSIVGDDYSGRQLISMLAATKLGVDVNFIINKDILTTEKLRIIGKHQQIIRVDSESDPLLYEQSLNKLDDGFIPLIEWCNIVIFSDYGKGVLAKMERMVKIAKQFNKEILIDPKGHKWTKYKGASLIKPNLDEMRDMCGGWDTEEELSSKAEKLLVDADIAAILLTRASDGMSLFNKIESIRIPTLAKNVFDVCGAGDVSIAAFAVARTMRFDYENSAKYANKAAGISVGRFGTVTVSKEEIFGITL